MLIVEMDSSAPAADKLFACGPPCFRTFKTAAALAQHKTDAPKHAATGPAPRADAEANAPHARQNGGASELHGTQGARIATPKNGARPAGDTGSMNTARKATSTGAGAGAARPFPGNENGAAGPAPTCSLCNRRFSTPGALADHVRDSPEHAAEKQQPAKKKPQNKTKTDKKTPTDAPAATPLDRFFTSHAPLPYDRSAPPAESFRQLARFRGWPQDAAARKSAWKAYQKALVAEVELWFGDVTDLVAWHQLCRAVGIKAPPPTIGECKKEVRRTHVNIVDLIQWGRDGMPAERPVEVFRTVLKLSQYIQETDKVFPRKDVIREDGTKNIVLKHLLRKVVWR